MPRRRLSSEEIQAELTGLPGWEVRGGKLHKAYKFPSFAQALGWMVAVGIQADKMDHHPEWANVYSRVSVSLVTHDLDNSISNLDVELAKHMDALATPLVQ